MQNATEQIQVDKNTAQDALLTQTCLDVTACFPARVTSSHNQTVRIISNILVGTFDVRATIDVGGATIDDECTISKRHATACEMMHNRLRTYAEISAKSAAGVNKITPHNN